MSLPSQAPRVGLNPARISGSARGFRPRGKKRKPLGKLLLLLLVAGVCFGAWHLVAGGDDTPKEAQASTPQTQDQTTDSDTATQMAAGQTTSAQAAPSARQPVTIMTTTNGRPASSTAPAIDQPIRRSPAGHSTTSSTPASGQTQPTQSKPLASRPNNAGTPPTQAPPTQPIQTQPEQAQQASRSGVVTELFAQGAAAQNAGRILDARDFFNRALHHPRATGADQAELRMRMAEIAADITFSPKIVSGDQLAQKYVIASGDSLSRINRNQATNLDWRFIQRINNISNPSRIRVGQSIKVVNGPFHAVVGKSTYRMDLYADAKDSAGNRLYLRSFPVGLGEYSSTPVGSWIVRDNSRLINPRWVNPRTGDSYEANDPANPIGERWVGLRGTDANTELFQGYGIHGTIEPHTIGTDASMGCVRMLPGDVELVYELMMSGVSEVEIVP